MQSGISCRTLHPRSGSWRSHFPRPWTLIVAFAALTLATGCRVRVTRPPDPVPEPFRPPEPICYPPPPDPINYPTQPELDPIAPPPHIPTWTSIQPVPLPPLPEIRSAVLVCEGRTFQIAGSLSIVQAACLPPRPPSIFGHAALRTLEGKNLDEVLPIYLDRVDPGGVQRIAQVVANQSGNNAPGDEIGHRFGFATAPIEDLTHGGHYRVWTTDPCGQTRTILGEIDLGARRSPQLTHTHEREVTEPDQVPMETTQAPVDPPPSFTGDTAILPRSVVAESERPHAMRILGQGMLQD